ncbi:MAG TPA: pilus assembly protein N-terminal domain-containing protein [Candidatus Goldiibacteriota bacterium]|nr:pilus assembly protein N-terminal domain-containing protein [Candidatus Goldiibacteriota bacterium]
MKKNFCSLVILLCLSFILHAENENEITIYEGTSKILEIKNVKSIEILKKEIATAIILSDEEILIEARKAGTSGIKINTDEGTKGYVVIVKKRLKAEAMIEIDVQILEIINLDNASFGIDWPTLIKAGDVPESGLIPLSPLNLVEKEPPTYNFYGSNFNRGQINVLIDFLVRNNYAKILAKPKLLTLNGQKAKFLAGGEVPVLTSSSLGQTNVSWKEYGVNLEMEPELTKSNNIKAKLRTEFSNLDYSNSVTLAGSQMPAVRTRWAETTITVAPDNTIIIAGLIQREEQKITNGVPLLSMIPLLGELFKSTTMEEKKTELVIFVTPVIIGSEI